MTSWKERFLEAASRFEDKDELEISYDFSVPASDNDILSLEGALQTNLPLAFKELLCEFNGIDVKQKYWGKGHLYLSTSYILNDIPKYFRESGNYVPEKAELESVVFFAQQNGLAVLFAICIKPFNEFQVGQVLSLESDTGEFELECDSLDTFVETSEYCHLG